MRILLVGNYPLDHQQSMLRYSEMLRRQLVDKGHQVEVLQPSPIIGNLVSQPFLRKWLGYIDKYLFFPIKLRSYCQGFDLVHICDHSNSMYLPCAGDRPASITCHDLIAIAAARGQYPRQHISGTGRMQQRWILKHLIAARHVVCVSSQTASELRSLAVSTVQNISIILHPLNYSYAPVSDEEVHQLRQTLAIADDPYLLHVGGNSWYKNRLGAIRIFHAFRKRRMDARKTPVRLILAGRPLSQEMLDYIAAHGLADSVTVLTNPSNEILRTLYSGASALLFPSLIEGFGWPLIEAQSSGCPVITSNRAPMTEVAGEAALYIDPEDESGAASLIAERFDDLHTLRVPGFRNLQRFDADTIAQQYAMFFDSIVSGKINQAMPRVVSQ